MAAGSSVDVESEPRAERHVSASAVEAIIAMLAAGLLMASSLLIRVNPRDRLGQISGLASIELRFFLFALVLIGALLVFARVRAGRGFGTSSRLVCAAVAGLATGLVASGIMIALRGTPWGLHTEGGDVTVLASWASALQRGESIPPLYPPLSLHVLAWWSDLVGLPPEQAIKHLQLLGTAAFGPFAYLSWRLLLRPPWALAIGVLSIVPLIDPYKPYPNLVLAVFVPVAILFLKTMRDAPDRSWREVVQASVGFGLGFGLLCLTYSGWFKWAAPGLLVATCVVFPWRTAPRKGLALLGITGTVFLLLTAQYLGGVLFDPATKIVDKFVYFDVRVEPMYIAMWRNDLPGVIVTWPPLGELGGVGLFSLLLMAGLAVAISLGRRTTLVIGLGAIMVGAWLLRFWYARALWETKLVQLYPRTTPLILYCLLVLTGLAVMWTIERSSARGPLRGRSAMIGAVCALLLVFGSVGSALSDRYMPLDSTTPGPGWLAWNAHKLQQETKPRRYVPRVMMWVRRSALPIPPSVPAPAPAPLPAPAPGSSPTPTPG